ncbi:NERD domain-containing protein [Actinoplanes bogorensis]|uniref:NERD domain-containing protein n=1 Tax=Paractinoplanes bogorensis TaxID=1610840 RepID=A0ABS5YS95_9ACTN|nr:NERD domain-containing protein [Actinoplanes bogorensis]MBU2666312.1 NERD domain-containing protein [Actinoplanes bogorensis]
MRVEVLSDHGGQQLAQTGRQLRAADTNVVARQRSYQRAQQDLESSRRAKSFWRRLFAFSTPTEQQALAQTENAWQGVQQAVAGREQLDQRVRQQAAGVQGELDLVLGLSGLDDSWTMLRGYRNRRGETDSVLVGPLGVWAVEVKRRRVRVHAVGEQWWYEKLSARGNVVEAGWAVDGGGRTWARQVNDVADDLAAWLARNGHPTRIRTAVMLMHEQAQFGRCEHLTVTMIGTHPAQLLDAIGRYASPLTAGECQQIVALICRDHRFHEQRRNRPRRGD